MPHTRGEIVSAPSILLRCSVEHWVFKSKIVGEVSLASRSENDHHHGFQLISEFSKSSFAYYFSFSKDFKNSKDVLRLPFYFFPFCFIPNAKKRQSMPAKLERIRQSYSSLQCGWAHTVLLLFWTLKTSDSSDSGSFLLAWSAHGGCQK